MAKPDFAQQNGDLKTRDEAMLWVNGVVDDFRNKGAQSVRWAYHLTIPNLYLVEGWKDKTAGQDAPHFFLEPA